jgi:hypothetical protein
MTKIVITIAIAIAALAATASTPIEPGQWVVTNQMTATLFDGRPAEALFPPAKAHSVCIKAADAAKGPGLALTSTNLCKVISSTLENGEFAFETECKATESDDIILTKTVGRYSSDSYVGTSTSIQHRDGMQIEMRSRIDAKRTGNC